MVIRRREALARRRRMLGLSQEDLAHALRVDRKTVARWESGESQPHPWMRTDLAQCLRLTLEELDLVLVPSELPAAPGEPERRPDLAEIAVSLDSLDRDYTTTPAVLLLAPVNTSLHDIAARRRASRAPREHRQLDALESRARVLLGQLLWDAAQRRSHEAAELQFNTAEEFAKRCGDPALEARALLRHSYLALYGQANPGAGLALTQRAADLARHVSPAIQALAELHAGEAHAMLRDKAASHHWLATGEQELARVDEFDPAFDLYSVSAGPRLIGSSLIRLHDYTAALRTLEEAAATATPGSKTLAIVLANIALALAKAGQGDGAATRLADAIDLIETTQGAGALNVAFQAGRELNRLDRSPTTADVVDRLMALVAG
jgi:transcriptional regulator with XRE-family HTH domain